MLVAAQEMQEPCPKIEVIGPVYDYSSPGEEMIFRLSKLPTAPIRHSNGRYNVAKFLSGQGTSKIVVIGDNAKRKRKGNNKNNRVAQ